MSDIANIKLLRERTGVGMMECKKALLQTDGDLEKAVELLRKAGQAKAVKKSGRITAEGLIGLKCQGEKAAIIEINSETDFVARDENFKQFVTDILEYVLTSNAEDIDVLKKHEVAGITLEKKREELVNKIGENINIRRFSLVSTKDNSLTTYLHGGKIGVIVVYQGGDESLAKDIAMHIAASNPIVIEPEKVPDSMIETEKEIFIARAKEEGTPESKIDLRIQNQIKKFVSQSCLLGQSFVKDPSKTVEKFLEENSMKVSNFVRYEVGEGIEKKEENFADEVRSQMK
jgi:elongation factor Ts